MFVCWSQPWENKPNVKIFWGYFFLNKKDNILWSFFFFFFSKHSHWTESKEEMPKCYIFIMVLQPVCCKLVILVSTRKCSIFIRLILQPCSYLWSDSLAVPARCCHSSLICDGEVVRWGTQITPPTLSLLPNTATGAPGCIVKTEKVWQSLKF